MNAYYFMQNLKENALISLARDVCALVDGRAETLQKLTCANRGEFIEELLTGKQKDSENAEDFGAYDIKLVCSKTGAHYNSSGYRKKYLLILYTKTGYELRETTKIIENPKSLNRVCYKENYKNGNVVSLEKILQDFTRA